MDVNIALFFHICGVLTLFGSAAIEIISLMQLRRASTVAVGRSWAGLNKPLEFTFPLGVVVLLITGLYMLHNNPDFKVAQPWALTVLVVLIVLAILGAAFNGQRMKAIAAGLETSPDGAIPREIIGRIHDSALFTSIMSMTGAIIGAVLIMTTKPGLRDSIIVAVVSMILGAAAAQLVIRRSAPLPEAAGSGVAVEAE